MAEGEDEQTLNDPLLFWTGYSCLPSSATTKLQLNYLPDLASKVMAEANTCPYSMSISIVHANFSQFKEFMDKTVAYAKRSFGKV